MIFLSKKSILGVTLGLASIITGGAQAARYIPTAPTEVIEETPQPTEPPVVEEISVEESAKEEETPSEETAGSSGTTPTSQPSTPKVGASANLGPHDDGYVAPQYTYHSIQEVEEAYMGVCPQDVPKDAWADPIQPSVALGISSLGKANTMKEWVKLAFNSYYTTLNGFWKDVRWQPIELLGFEYACAFRHGSIISNQSWWIFEIDWDTNTVSLTHDPASQFYPSEEQLAELNAAAREGSEYLAWIKSAYKAKCGEYKWR